MNNCFVIGVDNKMQWMLPWWLDNYYRHNTIPVMICDFGMREDWAKWSKERADGGYEKFPIREECSWFYKPLALARCKAEKKCWIDLDCEVLDDISGIFDYTQLDKITCAEDIYHSWGCKWQTGVFAVENNSKVLELWVHDCLNIKNRGDQEVLWDIVKRYPNIISEMPNYYNWLRRDVETGRECSQDPKIIHWTGPVGKQVIKEKIEK
tara:strand:- start:1076 stop:1702 length:627 start_codon:yes stop_codon:yes gene_type:complete